MRALMRTLRPTSFDDVAALVRALPAGTDGGQHAQRLRRPQERAQAGRVPAPRSRRGARRHVRPDDLPGVDDAGGPEVRRLLARRSRQPPQGVPARWHEDADQVARLRPDRAGDGSHGSARADHRHPIGDHAIRRRCRRLVGRYEASAAAHHVDGLRDRGDHRAPVSRGGDVATARRDPPRCARRRGRPYTH